MKQSEELREELISFFEGSNQFIGYTIKIHAALCTNDDAFDRHFTSYANQEFTLKNIFVRTSGFRAMFDGEKEFYEISVGDIISFEKNTTEYVFLEKLSETVYKKTEIEFEKIG